MKVNNQSSQTEKGNEFAQEMKGEQLKMKYFGLFKLQIYLFFLSMSPIWFWQL